MTDHREVEKTVRDAFRDAGIPGIIGFDPCIHRASPTPLLYIGLPVDQGQALADRLAKEREER